MIEFSMTGNLGADAVMNEVNGKKIVNMNICHSEAWRNREENKENKKYWVDCGYFCESEDLLKMLLKGTLVYVRGTPDVRIHIKKDNTPVAVQYLRVSKIEVLSKRKKEESTS